MKKLHHRFFALPIFLLFIGTNAAFSQPFIKVWGHQDSLKIQQRIVRYLDHLEVPENIYLIVRYEKRIPVKLSGMTSCLTSQSDKYQILEVRIQAHMSKRQQALVLAHEMIHVKQYAKGELVVLNDRQVLWKGQKHAYEQGWIFDYHRTPWEAEAHRADGRLVKLFSKQPPLPLTASSAVR